MTALSTLRSRLANEFLRDPNFRVFPSDTLDYALNQAQRDIQTRLKSMVDDTGSSTSTVASTQEYTLPTTFASLAIATIDGDELARTTLEELKAQFSSFTTGKPIYYYLRPGVIGLYPIPDGVYTLYILYSNLLAVMDGSTDAATPVGLDYALLCRAAEICHRQVARLDVAQVYAQEYEKAMNAQLLNLIADEHLSF